MNSQQDYSNLTLTNLMDLLMEQTSRFTHLFSEQAIGDEYDQCKKNIESIQQEIALRIKSQNLNKQAASPDITGIRSAQNSK